jgi:multicomponent K+:H+ antiporter subunit A
VSLLPVLVSLPFAAALLIALAPARDVRVPRWIGMAFSAAGCALLAWLTAGWSADAPPVFSVPWVPAIGLDFSLWLDGPALFFAWLVLGVGFLVFQYAGHYMDPEDAPRRFYGSLALFMGAMLGVVVSRNALLMFGFWELTSVSSFMLIGHWNRKREAVAGALRALLTTGAGGLCLLAGLALAGAMLRRAGIAEPLEWPLLWAQRELLLSHPWSPPLLVLLLLGAFTKSAQFPFHYWLPGAMEAPTPVSAYLHAATMVKAGIYLLGRLYPVFGGEALWLVLVGGAGVATMVAGGFMALTVRDIKQLLAHSTVSQLGLLTAYYGFGYGRMGSASPLPLDLMLIASHALFKGALFMLCGVIDHGTHTRDWTRLGGLRRSMPVTAALTVAGAASMMGAPLTLGFAAKELFLKAGTRLHSGSPLLDAGLPAVAVFASAFTVAYSLRLAVAPFFGAPRDPEIHPHEGGFGILFAPALLIAPCIAGGLWLPLVERPVGALVDTAAYGTASGFLVSVPMHVDLPTTISVVLLLAGGPLAYRLAGWMEARYAALGRPAPFAGLYKGVLLDGLPALAKKVGGFVQRPQLSRNVLLMAGIPCSLALWVLLREGLALDHGAVPGEWSVLAIAMVTVTLLFVPTTIHWKTTLGRVLSAGGVGLGLAGFYAVYNAPDIALTQILVELAALAMIVLLFARVRHIDDRPEPVDAGTALRAAVACGAGLLLAALTLLAATSAERNRPILAGNPNHADYYLANAKYPVEAGAHSAGGNNAVNVVLVDFRAWDTFGEITVLGIAAMGVLILLRVNRRERTQPEDDMLPRLGHAEQRSRPAAYIPFVPEAGPQMFLRKTAKPISVAMLAYAVVLFFQGHNGPGGGFIGGLLAAVAAVPWILAHERGKPWPFSRLTPESLIGPGLALALVAAVAPVFLGLELFRSGFAYVPVPVIGEVGLASAMVFDAGVFVMVVGVVLAMVRSFGRA